jgi:hypothetical protein
MTALMARQGNHGVRVTIGVDTHQDQHVAVAIDEQGVQLSEHRVVANSQGYAEAPTMVPQPGGDSRLLD